MGKPDKDRESKVTIKIPRPLYDKIRVLIADSGFNSPTDFIVFVLRDLVGEQAGRPMGRDLTPQEVEAIRTRLKNLGYL